MLSERAIPVGLPRVRTPRLLLRPPEPADEPALVRVLTESDGHLAAWSPLRPEGITIAMHVQSEIARAHTSLAEGRACRLIAFLEGGGDHTDPPRSGGAPAPPRSGGPPGGPPRPIGGFNLNNICRGVMQGADAGWWLAADAVGHGYATEALGALLDLAFAPAAGESGKPRGLGLHRVQANIVPDNHRSIAVAQRCGFRREGLARAMIMIAGRWQDHINFAKLAEEHVPTGAVLQP